MSELSLPWNGTSLGDATIAPYDADTEWALYTFLQSGVVAQTSSQGGVFLGAKNGGQATGSATPVVIDTMYAIVQGTAYENTAAVSVTVPTPGSATRIDRIVLEKDWALQTVRITRIAGIEGGSEPALVQVAGNKWDEPLWKCSITTGGVITLTDERQCLGMRPGTYVRDTITFQRYPAAAWNEANGQAIVRANYKVLTYFLVNEPTGASPYGNGDGVTTINLPNMRGRPPAMYDAPASVLASFAAMGVTLGTASVTLNGNQSGIQNHGHTLGTLALGSMATTVTPNSDIQILDTGSAGGATWAGGGTLERNISVTDFSAVTTGAVTGAVGGTGPTNAINSVSLLQPIMADEVWVFLGGL